MPNHITNELTCEHKSTLDSVRGKKKADLIDFNKVTPMPKLYAFEPDMGTTEWAEICCGTVNLSTLRRSHANPADSFRSGDYGAATDALKQSNAIRSMTEGPFPKDFDDTRFENLIRSMRCLRLYGHVSWLEWSQENWGTKWNAYSQKRISDKCIRFDTAWNPPIKVISELSLKFPKEKFCLRWASEDFGCNAGSVVIRNGEVVEGGKLENDSLEAHQLAFELVYDGELPEEMKWQDGRLIYVEDE